MNAAVEVHADGNRIIIVLPMAVRKRGGRKMVCSPDGITLPQSNRPRIDNTLIKAVARAHRWKNLLERGEYATIKDLAAAERINLSYLSRILRLALFAPDIVEAILEGRNSRIVIQDDLRKPIPVCWAEQRKMLGS